MVFNIKKIALLIIITFSFSQDTIGEGLLGDDLIGKTFTSHETHLLSQRILRAKQYCFRGDEEESINAINSARELAGLKPTTGTFDWENVPIEEIIKDPAY